jgi:hypothetical protein
MNFVAELLVFLLGILKVPNSNTGPQTGCRD